MEIHQGGGYVKKSEQVSVRAVAPLAESESVVQVAQVPVRAVIVWEYEGLRELFESELKEDNMAGVKTTVKVPEFDRENIQMYIDELLMWQFVTDVDKKKQGPLVWMSLPKDEPSNIKQFINDSIGIDNLSKDDGIDKLIEAMKKAKSKHSPNGKSLTKSEGKRVKMFKPS